jgi:hypothetical protein
MQLSDNFEKKPLVSAAVIEMEQYSWFWSIIDHFIQVYQLLSLPGEFLLPNPEDGRGRFPKRELLGRFLLKRLGADVVVEVVLPVVGEDPLDS